MMITPRSRLHRLSGCLSSGRAHLLAMVWILIVTASAISAHHLTNDYRPSVDFSTFQTFMWTTEPECGNRKLTQAIIDGINSQLESKGMYLRSSKADLEVRAHIATGARRTLQSFYEGLSPDWNWHHYLGPGSAGTFT